MKNKLLIAGLITVFICSCSSSRDLPSVEGIDVYEYGSIIAIYRKSGKTIRGELIAIDRDKLIVLTDSPPSNRKLVILPIAEARSFTLRYAQPKHYGATILLYTLATISHGFWAAITLPINLIVTISVTAAGENAFTYSNKNITYEKLKMFARFPQGIPLNVDLSGLK